MTWSKVYTSTVAVDDIDADSGASMLTVLDELFQTWLPARGWTTALQQGTRPSPSSGLYHWWMDKAIQCIDGSYYSHRVEFTLNPASSESFGYRTWEPGVTADTQFNSAEINSQNLNSRVEGTWEMWTSDQDSDSFLIITNNNPRALIAYMPPTGSIIHSAGNGISSPVETMPIIPSDGSQYCWHSQSSYEAMYPALRAYSPSTSTNSGQVVKFNAQFCNVGQTSSIQPAFVTSTNDCAMLYQASDSSLMSEIGTLQVGTEFFIRVGTQGNALLFSTGTTDPQL